MLVIIETKCSTYKAIILLSGEIGERSLTTLCGVGERYLYLFKKSREISRMKLL